LSRSYFSNFQFPESLHFITDSALYTEDNIKAMGDEVLWMTRVPATIKMVK